MRCKVYWELVTLEEGRWSLNSIKWAASTESMVMCRSYYANEVSVKKMSSQVHRLALASLYLYLFAND